MSKMYGAQQRQMQAPSNPLAIKTKKFALEKNKFVGLCMRQLFSNQWKFAFIPLALVLGNVALNLTGATVTAQIRKQSDAPVIYQIETAITNATSGEFEFSEQIIDIPNCNYKYDVRIELANGEVNSWIEGQFIITERITTV